jgi:hypothetical protein
MAILRGSRAACLTCVFCSIRDYSVYGEFAMTALLTLWEQVRFRTEKSLFFSGFAATFLAGSAAIPTLSAGHNKRTHGLVC